MLHLHISMTGPFMLTLFHHPMLVSSRYVRLILAEYGEDIQLIEEMPWMRRKEFLSVNPANTFPLLLAEGDVPVIGGRVIAEYLDETRGPLMRGTKLFPEGAFARSNVRQMANWYLEKFNIEVAAPLIKERVFKPIMPSDAGGGSPDTKIMRQARANLIQHMKYTNWMAGTRNWLAGDDRTYADLAGAAALSVMDYLGEINWSEYPAAKDWYGRLKSRPSFRPLLTDRIRAISPSAHYADLDF